MCRMVSACAPTSLIALLARLAVHLLDLCEEVLQRGLVGRAPLHRLVGIVIYSADETNSPAQKLLK